VISYVVLITLKMAHPLLILYGSQTGNALDVAELVCREARRRHFAPRLMSADAYVPLVSSLPGEPAIVLCVSTTGQGEMPHNARRLWKFLRRKSLPPGSLAAVTAAVFGLGDSGYPKYNVAAKLMFRRLETLGACMAAPLGLGDDQHRGGYDAGLDDWLPRLWKALRARFPLEEGLQEASLICVS
jgi:sulfite reductase alpha subunit-like flavoprotein